MKKFLCVGVACGALLSGYVANAADWDRELQQLREDVLVLQRQVYRGVESSEKGASAANADFQVKVTNWEENVRQLNGRIDEMDYKVKEIDKKLDKINRDMEIRFKILEGRPVPADLSAPAPSMPQTYDAPVASDGAAAVVGDKISGDDLTPVGGGSYNHNEEENSAEKKTEAKSSMSADDMYAAGMQAYNSGLNDEAELAFKNILSQYPKHALASNAQYWLGEVYTKQGDLNNAKVAFKNGYQNYKSGNKAPDSLYRLGITLENLKDNKSACIVFMSFDAEFPKANAELKRKAAAEAKKLGCQ